MNAPTSPRNASTIGMVSLLCWCGCLGLGFVDGEDECADESEECDYVWHSCLLC